MSLTRIGDYIIDRELGSGGMGTVYLARHAETGQEVAVKVLPAALAREEGFVARFTREIESLKALKNPHVVELYESGVDGETYYYAMEYVEGDTVAARLREQKRIPWREVIDIGVQVCSALKAAHDAGIIHRDLKPSNLIITPDGTVKLTDFGVAQMFAKSKLTATGGIIGTAEYMSPEQATGRRVTRHSDLYSLGAMMYVMLTGRPPFSGRTTIDIIQKHKFAQFDRPRLIVPDIPHWLEEIVCCLLEKDPAKRYPDAYVVSRRLQEVVNKVDLSMREQTMAIEGEASGGDSTTHAVSSDRGPGPGTLIRDLMQVEIERSQARTPLGNLLNSTWVLMGLLALLIGGVYWMATRKEDPQERFDQGVALMNGPEGDAWIEAKQEYFLPLAESDPAAWQEKVEPYLNEIELYELKSRIGLEEAPRRRSRSQGETQRFLQLAKHYSDAGDTARAVRTLEALRDLLDGDPERKMLFEVTESQLQALRQLDEKQASRHTFLEQAMNRADSLAEQGDLQAARRIWAGVIELYGLDPAASTYVNRARTSLGQAPLGKQ